MATKRTGPGQGERNAEGEGKPRDGAGKGRSRTAGRRGADAGGKTARPRLKAHVEQPGSARPRASAAARPARAKVKPPPAPLPVTDATGPVGGVRKAPLSGPRRGAPRRSVPPAAEPSAAARELALAIAAAGIEKKALGIEILDVTGRVDYADFLVVMTGRSDRHVHAIATGLEELLARTRKTQPLSVEGREAATWVLMDYGEVVVHVFQEDARRLYDIEGLWIDANRVPVPEGAAPVVPSARDPH